MKSQNDPQATQPETTRNQTALINGPHRLVASTSRCGRDNPGSTPGEDIYVHGYIQCYDLCCTASMASQPPARPPRTSGVMSVCMCVCACVCVRVCAHGALAPLPHHASDRVALPCASVIFGLCLERLPMVLALRLQARAKICRERLSCCACLLPGIPEMVPPSPLSSAGSPPATSGVPG